MKVHDRLGQGTDDVSRSANKLICPRPSIEAGTYKNIYIAQVFGIAIIFVSVSPKSVSSLCLKEF